MSSVPQPIILVLLDIPPMLPVLDGVVMELQDCALPLLRGPLPISNQFTPSPKGCIKLRLILIQCSSTGTVSIESWIIAKDSKKWFRFVIRDSSTCSACVIFERDKSLVTHSPRLNLQITKRNRSDTWFAEAQSVLRVANALSLNTLKAWLGSTVTASLHNEQQEVCVVCPVLLLVHSEPIKTVREGGGVQRMGCVVKTDWSSFW